MKWLWKFVDAAAGELYGRTMVVFAAQHYAIQLVLPTSQRRSSRLPGSHKDIARKAFERVTKRVLPGSYTQLQRALTSEARDYQRKIAALEQATRDERGVAAAAAAPTAGDDTTEDAGGDVQGDVDAGELAEDIDGDLDVDEDPHDDSDPAGPDEDLDVDELDDE